MLRPGRTRAHQASPGTRTRSPTRSRNGVRTRPAQALRTRAGTAAAAGHRHRREPVAIGARRLPVCADPDLRFPGLAARTRLRSRVAGWRAPLAVDDAVACT